MDSSRGISVGEVRVNGAILTSDASSVATVPQSRHLTAASLNSRFPESQAGHW
jgi:hypothetical protein